jgi:hypothetical protein
MMRYRSSTFTTAVCIYSLSKSFTSIYNSGLLND